MGSRTISYIIANLCLTDITTCKGGQIPYGERVTLRPEPPHERQSFSKGGYIFGVSEMSL